MPIIDIMNYINFEDTIFILNMRIRLVRDTLRLNPPTELFMSKILDDLVFVGHTLSVLAESLIENTEQGVGNDELSYASDAEWQFSQLLTEFTAESTPFSAQAFPETMEKITELRHANDARRKALDECGVPEELARSESMVSSVELSRLLESV